MPDEEGYPKILKAVSIRWWYCGWWFNNSWVLCEKVMVERI